MAWFMKWKMSQEPEHFWTNLAWDESTKQFVKYWNFDTFREKWMSPPLLAAYSLLIQFLAVSVKVNYEILLFFIDEEIYLKMQSKNNEKKNGTKPKIWSPLTESTTETNPSQIRCLQNWLVQYERKKKMNEERKTLNDIS